MVILVQPYRKASSAFSPDDVTGLHAWWDASDSSTISHTSGNVDSWSDKSGNGHTLTASGSARPTTNATTRNGLNVIDFASSGPDQMSHASKSAFKAFHDGTDHHVFVVFNMTGPNNTLINLVGTMAVNTTNVGFCVMCDDRSSLPRNERPLHIVFKGSSGVQVVGNVSSSDNALPFNTWQIFHVAGDADDSTVADRSAMEIDGGAAIKNNVSTVAPSTANHTLDLWVGGLSSAHNMDGSIAEILMYDQLVSAGDISSIETYLADKWGITL